jgi:hypothetical protein
MWPAHVNCQMPEAASLPGTLDSNEALSLLIRLAFACCQDQSFLAP